MLIVMQMGLVHPPVGLNIYIINSLSRDVPILETFKGVIPFLASDLIRVVFLFFFPSVTLWLVHLMNQ
jgi:C4-dicarboxylate transporter DctM subunit